MSFWEKSPFQPLNDKLHREVPYNCQQRSQHRANPRCQRVETCLLDVSGQQTDATKQASTCHHTHPCPTNLQITPPALNLQSNRSWSSRVTESFLCNVWLTASPSAALSERGTCPSQQHADKWPRTKEQTSAYPIATSSSTGPGPDPGHQKGSGQYPLF